MPRHLRNESILPLPRTATVCEAPVAETVEFGAIPVLARLTLTYEVSIAMTVVARCSS